MDDLNIIRAIIFLVPGLALVLFPKKVYQFQLYLVRKIGIKYQFKNDTKSYPYIGIVFIIISLGLFIFSMSN